MILESFSTLNNSALPQHIQEKNVLVSNGGKHLTDNTEEIILELENQEHGDIRTENANLGTGGKGKKRERHKLMH